MQKNIGVIFQILLVLEGMPHTFDLTVRKDD